MDTLRLTDMEKEDAVSNENNAKRIREDMTSDITVPKRKIRFHDALKRTTSLLGDEDSSKEWVSEMRSNFSLCPSATFPRQRPALFVTQLDGSRRNNPQPRLASIFRARHGQRDVCAVETVLPAVPELRVTETSAYTIEFPTRPLAVPTRLKSAPLVHEGILPSCRVPIYHDVRDEILLPVQISEKSPSTENPNKYMPRRRRISESVNQHRTHQTPYGIHTEIKSAPTNRSQRHFVTNQGKPLANRRHVSAPPNSLTVKGFDGGAPKATLDTMHSRLLPYLRGPRII